MSDSLSAAARGAVEAVRRIVPGAGRRAEARLAAPPQDLGGFPASDLPAGARLFQIDTADRGPTCLSGDGDGRFDIPDRPRVGTCYLAEEPLGAFVEVFDAPRRIAASEVRGRRLFSVSFDRPLRLADCTSGLARCFGVTAEIHATTDREATQRWAAALRDAGFDGVRYLVRGDPRQRLRGVALFEDLEAEDGPRWQVGDGPIPADLMDGANEVFGCAVDAGG